MATVKMNKSGAIDLPSTEIIKTAVQEHVVVDSAGRNILLRKPGPLAQYRLIEAAGASAENVVYMNMCLPLVYVASIDGLPVAAIATKAHLEALIQRLDEHGINKVIASVNEFYGNQDPKEDREKLKN